LLLKMIMKKVIKVLVLIVIFTFICVPLTNAQEHTVDVYFFWGEGCPHCAKEKFFLEKLQQEINYIELHSFEVWHDKQGQEILLKLTRESNINPAGVPITIIGNQVSYGFGSEETTGEELRHLIEICHITACADRVGEVIGDSVGDGLETAIEAPVTETPEESQLIYPDSESGPKPEGPSGLEASPLPKTIGLPFFGEIDIANFSLPILTLIIAALDGFNPCAMWVLVFLISLLLGIPNAGRRWLLGLVFILASGFVYFLFLAAWLNLFLFLGFLIWVRIAVGVLAIFAGVYYLREFWVNREGVCKVTSSPTRRWILDYLKEAAQGKKLIIALGGIILIAFAVNLIELICSAGLPAIYTQVLALSELPKWQYYLYLIEYIVVFMLDDLIVFSVAMVTLQMAGLGTKYSRYSNLIGGIIIAILGLLLIFKPGLLMFGG